MAAPTNPVRPITFGKALGGRAGVPTVRYKESASLAGKAGSPVLLVSGLIDESTSPLSSANKLLGFLEADARGITNADIGVHLAVNDILWEGTLAKTAVVYTSLITDLGLIYPLTLDTVSLNWYLDTTAAATDGGMVVEFRDPVGTADARVYFKLTRGQVLGG